MEKIKKNIIHFIPALSGDCILLEFDNQECILIDCGYKSTYNKELKPLLLELSKRDYRIKLLIVSHIDADHIEGAIQLLEDNGDFNSPQVIAIDNIWFNGFYSTLFMNDVFKQHISNTISEVQNEKMRIVQGQMEMQSISEVAMISGMQSKSFEELCSDLGYRVNHQFPGQVVKRKSDNVETVTDDKIYLGNFCITVLSPNDFLIDKLAEELNIELIKIFGDNYEINNDWIFRDFYEKLTLLIREEPIETNVLISTERDEIEGWLGTSTLAAMNSVNKASIVVKIEYKEIKMLFTGDSDSELWGDYLEPYYDVIKISHHGTLKPNLCMIKKTKGNHILISTNGRKHGHPEKDLIANLMLSNSLKLHFNYDLDIEDVVLRNQEKYSYKASFNCSKIDLEQILSERIK